MLMWNLVYSFSRVVYIYVCAFFSLRTICLSRKFSFTFCIGCYCVKINTFLAYDPVYVPFMRTFKMGGITPKPELRGYALLNFYFRQILWSTWNTQFNMKWNRSHGHRKKTQSHRINYHLEASVFQRVRAQIIFFLFILFVYTFFERPNKRIKSVGVFFKLHCCYYHAHACCILLSISISLGMWLLFVFLV